MSAVQYNSQKQIAAPSANNLSAREFITNYLNDVLGVKPLSLNPEPVLYQAQGEKVAPLNDFARSAQLTQGMIVDNVPGRKDYRREAWLLFRRHAPAGSFRPFNKLFSFDEPLANDMKRYLEGRFHLILEQVNYEV